MLRRVNFFGIILACGVCLLFLLAGSRYGDNVNYKPAEVRRSIKNFLKINDNNDNSLDRLDSTLYPDEEVSLDVEKIFEKTRSKIRSNLTGYNFTSITGVNELTDLILENGGNPLRSVIISTWRSGTTFLGEVLNSVPGNFYHYEPLLNYEIIQIRGPPHAKVALQTIRKLLKCDYEDLPDYFQYGKTHLHLFHHNTRLWDHCKYNKALCFDPILTSKFCSLFPFQSMKVVRVRLRLMEELLNDPELNIKVILLVRDPRAVIQSRQHRAFCPPSPDCWQPSLLCADMVSDYVAASYLVKALPNRVKVLRYEDLALDPYKTLSALFKFLELSMTQSVNELLKTHTTIESGGVSSTFRVSKDVPFKWTNILPYSRVSQIQHECKEALNHWGYVPANNETHMRSSKFKAMKDYHLLYT